MRATSTAVSLAAHVVVVIAALATTTGAHPRVTRPPVIIDLPPLPGPIDAPAPSWPSAPPVEGGVTLPPITPPIIDGIPLGPSVAFAPPVPGPNFAPATPGSGGPVDVSIVDDPPAMLAGPLPSYPDLLRQAGIHGRVVLEAVIDTLGHVERGSVVVIESAHPAFVVPAQRSLVASLFRPARVAGRAVPVRVRLAFDFVVRDGRL